MRTPAERAAACRAYVRNREYLIARQKERYVRNHDAIEEQRRAKRDADRAADPEGYLAKGRERYQRERDIRNSRARAARIADPNADRLRDHGLTESDYAAMLAGQDGKCAICLGAFGTRGNRIDHDHNTGRVRGLLCHNCNVALGHFRDDLDILARAAAYVRDARLRRAA